MVDHLTLKVRRLERSKLFYAAALRPLGFELLMELDGTAGFGPFKPEVWITADPENVRPMHFALAAPDHASVDAFHAAALAAGGKDNGKPGIRAHYHPNYYAAYVLDPDGHNVEAVCHEATKRARLPSRSRSRKSGGEERA